MLTSQAFLPRFQSVIQSTEASGDTQSAAGVRGPVEERRCRLVALGRGQAFGAKDHGDAILAVKDLSPRLTGERRDRLMSLRIVEDE